MRYEFIVPGPVSQDLAAALPELTIAPSATGGTSLFGPVIDESDSLDLYRANPRSRAVRG